MPAFTLSGLYTNIFILLLSYQNQQTRLLNSLSPAVSLFGALDGVSMGMSFIFFQVKGLLVAFLQMKPRKMSKAQKWSLASFWRRLFHHSCPAADPPQGSATHHSNWGQVPIKRKASRQDPHRQPGTFPLPDRHCLATEGMLHQITMLLCGSPGGTGPELNTCDRLALGPPNLSYFPLSELAHASVPLRLLPAHQVTHLYSLPSSLPPVPSLKYDTFIHFMMKIMHEA